MAKEKITDGKIPLSAPIISQVIWFFSTLTLRKAVACCLIVMSIIVSMIVYGKYIDNHVDENECNHAVDEVDVDGQ